MDETHLYQQIASQIRSDILEGRRKPGERLPSVREMCAQWSCTPGTVQRAYQELAQEGLVVSLAGRGTQVAGGIPPARAQAQQTLRKVGLLHRAEAFLLEMLTAGYALDDIQQALDLAADRWHTLEQSAPSPAPAVLRFAGSHDLVVSGLAHYVFGEEIPAARLELTFSGSLSGLRALADGQADLCGCHLLAESGEYNLPWVRELFAPGAVQVVTLAHRRLGLIVAPGNPLGIQSVRDLAHPGVRFINRQAGSGTRVWLDAALAKEGIAGREINGYRDERLTHSAVARAVAENEADAALGLETAARAYSQDFIPLARERYDLVLRNDEGRADALVQLVEWLQSEAARQFVEKYAGYEAAETGKIQME